MTAPSRPLETERTSMPAQSIRSQTRLGVIPAAVVFVMIFSGCARFDLRRNIPWQQEPEGPPVSVVAFWTDAVLERTGGPPYRGFGGRLLFYSRDMTRSIRAKGTLVVYAFDDDLPPPENLKPVRKFVFTSEQMAQMESESNMGPSYSVLIPWDQFSPEPQRLSLMVRLIPESGGSIISEQARVFLPGLANPGLASPKPHSPDTYAGTRRADASSPQIEDPRHSVRQTAYAETASSPEAASIGAAPFRSASDSPADTAREQSQRMRTLTLSLGNGTGLGPGSGSGSAEASQIKPPTQTGAESRGAATIRLREENAAPHSRIRMESAAEAPAHPNGSSWGWAGPAAGTESPPTPGQMIKETAQQPSSGFRPAQFPAPGGPTAPPAIAPDRMGRSLEAPPFGLAH